MTFFFPTQHKIIQVVAWINSLFLFIAEEYSSQRKAMTNLDSVFKSRDNSLPKKVHLLKAMVFPVIMYTWELDHKEGWMPKNWCFWIVDLEKALESPLDSKENKPVNSTGNQLFFFLVVDFVIHWNETAMGLHVFPIPIPPPTSLSTRSL